MVQLKAVSRQEHDGKTWKLGETYHFAARDSLVPLVWSEVNIVSTGLPMAFVNQQDKFVLVAMQSYVPDQNLLVGLDGKWLGKHLPMVYRKYPFRLVKKEKAPEMILCVDEESGLVTEDMTGKPFFEETGELTKPVKDILEFLGQVETDRAATDQMVALLVETGAVIKWNLPITGLYKIDQSALDTLDDESFLKLRRAGALHVAYGQLFSMWNLSVFEKLTRVRVRAASKKALETKVILGDDDVISFQ